MMNLDQIREVSALMREIADQAEHVSTAFDEEVEMYVRSIDTEIQRNLRYAELLEHVVMTLAEEFFSEEHRGDAGEWAFEELLYPILETINIDPGGRYYMDANIPPLTTKEQQQAAREHVRRVLRESTESQES
jgi:antitoxin component of MazEF toxin-antitoxin module